MLDIFYTLLLVSLFVVWRSSARLTRLSKFLGYMRARTSLVSVVLWAVFLIVVAAYSLYFTDLARMHDIPNAVNSAVISEEHGVNPYEANVVPRFESGYSPNPVWAFGPYNYLSLDLVIYTGFHTLLGVLGMPGWFVATNLIFSGVAFLLLREMLQVSWKYYGPIAGIAMLFYLFDNASLTLLLIIFSMYLFHNLKPNHESLATVVMGLAVMTKVYAIIPFAVLVLFQLQGWYKTKNWHVFARISGSVAASGAISVALMLPFGIEKVLRSAVLFHTSTASRVGTSSGGTLLTQILLSSTDFMVVSVALVLFAMIASMKMRSMNDRMVLVSLVFLLVVVKSSLALLIIPGIFIPLGMKELSLRMPRKCGRASSSVPSDPSIG